MVNEDARVKAVADELWFALKRSFWSNIYGLAYFDLGGIYDGPQSHKQSKVQRLGNTNCSPLIYYKNPSVINPPLHHPRYQTALPAFTTFSGIVSGLPNGQSLTLARIDSNQSLEVSANGYFEFILSSDQISGYSITISSMPSGYNCIFNNGWRTVEYMMMADLGNISIVCSVLPTPTMSAVH
jgi:hypothetical protein